MALGTDLYRKWVLVGVLALPLIAFVVYSIHVSEQYQNVRRFGEKTVGEIVVFGSDVICTFNLNGVETIKRMSKPHKSIKDGEKYFVYYYSDIPGKYYIDFLQPVIDSSLFVQTVTTDLQLKGDFFLFKYRANGRDYERYQRSISQISESQAYSVFYNINDPGIAYVVFNDQSN